MRTKVCHICSYYENILFDNLVSSQRDFTDPRVFFYKKIGTPKYYEKNYVDEVTCFSQIDRLFFFVKAHKAFRKYQQLYAEQQFDLLFAHSLFTNGYVAYLAHKKYGVPYVVMIQNTDMNAFYRFKPYLSGVANKILKNASKIIFASPSYQTELLKKRVPAKIYSLVSSKCVVIPYGIEDLFFEKSILQEKKIDTNGKIRIVCVGLICHNKNQIRLAEAISNLNHKGYDICLTVIGKAERSVDIAKLQAYPFVSVLPYLDKEKLKGEYQKSDLFALVSITETFGLVYAEALSQGLPIIYSKGQGFDGQFIDGYVGYAADATDIGSIEEAITKALNNLDILKSRTKTAAENYKWDRVTKLYHEMYKEVLRRPGDDQCNCNTKL